MEALAQALRTEHAIIAVVLAYFCGSIPFGYLLARFVGKKDIRTSGSGNIGATNVARVLGKKLGVVTLVLDALKGAIPVAIALYYFSNSAVSTAASPSGDVVSDVNVSILGSIIACTAFLGHCFPIWLRFKGGKGVATGLGVLVVYAPVVAAVGIFVFAMVFALTRMVSASALTAGVALVGVVLWLRPIDAALIPLGVMFVVMVVRHRGNMLRILRKEESTL